VLNVETIEGQSMTDLLAGVSYSGGDGAIYPRHEFDMGGGDPHQSASKRVFCKFCSGFEKLMTLRVILRCLKRITNY
jgi:hypothetical protein